MVAAMVTHCALHLDLRVESPAYEVYELRRARSLLPPATKAQEEEEQLRAKLAMAMNGELFNAEGELTSAYRNGDNDWLWTSWSMAVDRPCKGALGDTAAMAAPAKGKLR
eukprot:12457989-Alexandrium_andersonii.AAC.1